MSSSITAFVITSVNYTENEISRTKEDKIIAMLGDLRSMVLTLHAKLDTAELQLQQTSNTLSDQPAYATTELTNMNPTEMPKMVMVDPTPQQNQVFEELKSLLDQPRYIESLNLDTLSKNEDLASLPKALQMVIISKAIEKFNKGEVDKNTFLSK